MDDLITTLGHGAFTCLAWVTSHWTGVGAAVLVYKLIDRHAEKKLQKRRRDDG